MKKETEDEEEAEEEALSKHINTLRKLGTLLFKYTKMETISHRVSSYVLLRKNTLIIAIKKSFERVIRRSIYLITNKELCKDWKKRNKEINWKLYYKNSMNL